MLELCTSFTQIDLLALFGSVFALIRAVEKLPVEKLNGDHGKNELKEKKQLYKSVK